MATANWQSKQPTNLNYLSPVNFEFQISKLPKTKYFCIGVTLPAISLSENTQGTTLGIPVYLPGDKLTFDPLGIKFIVFIFILVSMNQKLLLNLYMLFL